jgi:hypothetical protein
VLRKRVRSATACRTRPRWASLFIVTNFVAECANFFRCIMLPHALHRGSEQFASMCVANFLASFAHFVARAVGLPKRFVAARTAYADS